MMNRCAIQQKNAYASRGDMGRDYVVCPKPRRPGLFDSSARPACWNLSHQAGMYGSKAGNELLDIILCKDGGQDSSELTYGHMPSSPPFFSGSPPSRVSNPLIQDARFVEEKHYSSVACATLPILNLGISCTPSSSSWKGGRMGSNFDDNPAVRVEGFEALNKDRRNCSIPALA